MFRYWKLRRILREIDEARAKFEGTHYDIFSQWEMTWNTKSTPAKS